MATLASALNFARAQTQTDSNGLTDANGIIFANEALLDFRRKLISNGVDAGGTQEAYRDATANQGTYLYPTAPGLFWLKTIELRYAGTAEQDYKLATQVDASNLPGQVSFSWMRTNADKTAPNFDDRGDYYEIFPTPTSGDALTSLIRLIYFPMPTEYSATSDTIAYPESLDYRILGWRIAANYYMSLTKFDEADKVNLNYENRVKDLVATLSRGSQQPIQPSALPLDGWDF